MYTNPLLCQQDSRVSYLNNQPVMCFCLRRRCLRGKRIVQIEEIVKFVLSNLQRWHHVWFLLSFLTSAGQCSPAISSSIETGNCRGRGILLHNSLLLLSFILFIYLVAIQIDLTNAYWVPTNSLVSSLFVQFFLAGPKIYLCIFNNFFRQDLQCRKYSLSG